MHSFFEMSEIVIISDSRKPLESRAGSDAVRIQLSRFPSEQFSRVQRVIAPKGVSYHRGGVTGLWVQVEGVAACICHP